MTDVLISRCYHVPSLSKVQVVFNLIRLKVKLELLCASTDLLSKWKFPVSNSKVVRPSNSVGLLERPGTSWLTMFPAATIEPYVTSVPKQRASDWLITTKSTCTQQSSDRLYLLEMERTYALDVEFGGVILM